MKTFALLAVLGLVCAGATSAVAGRDPRSERLRLNQRDTALAKRITLGPRDVERGWRRVRAPAPTEGSSGCKRFRPDLSRFTITGRAASQFVATDGSGIASAVAVFASRAQAAADFRASTTPAAVHCIAAGFMAQVRKGLRGRAAARLVAAQRLRVPRVGERSAAYRIVAEVRVRTRRLRIHGDVFGIQRGRAQGSLLFVWVFSRISTEMTYARELAYKMRLAE